MAGVTVTLDETEVGSTLEGLMSALQDMTPMLKNVGEHVQATTIDRFARQVSPAGLPWAQLNSEYAKTKKGPGILRETGQLAQIIYQVAADLLQVGTNAVYAAAHQFGAVIKPKTAAALVFSLGGRTIFASSVTIPKREFLGLTPEDIIEIGAIVGDYLEAESGGSVEIAGPV